MFEGQQRVTGGPVAANYVALKECEGPGQRLPNAPQGRVGEALTGTLQITEALHQELAILESRLSSLLRPSYPDGENRKEGANTASEQPSALAVGLDELNGRLQQAVRYLRQITARIDL